MPTSSLPSSLRRLHLRDNQHYPPLAHHTPSSLTLQPADSSFYPRDEDAQCGYGFAAASGYSHTPSNEQGLDLDLGDGASYSGSRGNTFERRRRPRATNSLYI